MNCMAIKLQDRRAASATSYKKSQYENAILFSDEFHRYEFRYDRPVRPSKEPNPVITEVNLNFPENCKTPHSAGQSRWTQKRPRLKSTKRSKKPISLPPDTPIQSTRSECEIGTALIEEIKNSPPPNILEASEMFGDACEVDPDIQKLILECQKAEEEPQAPPKENHKKKRKKHSGKSKSKSDKKASAKKINKTVSISISKPPSPQTVQVIRVDVISNYSLDHDERKTDLVTCKTAMEPNEKNYRVPKEPQVLFRMIHPQEVDDTDLEIKCMKVTLSDRC